MTNRTPIENFTTGIAWDTAIAVWLAVAFVSVGAILAGIGWAGLAGFFDTLGGKL